MKVAVFSTKPYDRHFLEKANQEAGHQFSYFEPRLSSETVSLGFGYEAICCFVNDTLHQEVLHSLHHHGLRYIALRCAGFNNLDTKAAKQLGIKVARVPAYSPYAVAEHAMALILTLNRKTHRAYNRVRDGNFSIDGLLGFDLHGKTVCCVGTGKIGTVFCKILQGFGCRILAVDPYPSDGLSSVVEYTSLEEALPASDVVALHCPLTTDTFHMINDERLARMKPGAMLVNTSRGGLVDTRAVIKSLKSGHLGSLAIDVYEEEENLFFEDHSAHIITDDTFSRLLTFPNVLITSHQAFFTDEAMRNIASVTVQNLTAFEQGSSDFHEVP
ncbi:MAG: 2-hydroxyacid dehydrogenase [Fimbriimonadaceae bacterium]